MSYNHSGQSDSGGMIEADAFEFPNHKSALVLHTWPSYEWKPGSNPHISNATVHCDASELL